MESNHREAADLKTLVVKGETTGSEDGSDDVEIVGNRRVARILDVIARVVEEKNIQTNKQNNRQQNMTLRCRTKERQKERKSGRRASSSSMCSPLV